MDQIGELYLEHKSWLSTYIQKRLGCPHATADLLQDTYLRLMTKKQLPVVEESRKFLTHIAKGLVIDLHRKRRIEQAYLEYLEQWPEPEFPSPEFQVQAIQALVEVDKLIHTLPDKARQALLMRQLDGMSYKEIACQLRVSVSSVEKYIAKAMQSCLMGVMDVYEF